MTYKQALALLHARPDFEQRQDYSYVHDFKLARVAFALTTLGDPQNSFSSIVVAGTNGKGSVAAMVAEGLRAQGYKVGLYTSPHMLDLRERIKVNKTLISTRAFAAVFGTMKERLHERMMKTLTYFEFLTIAAFMYFDKEQIDFAVLEVGMGGRLDATNVVDPIVSVITKIGFDHEHKLGNTLTKIAREKAGIIKRNGVVVSSPQHPEALAVIRGTAKRQCADLHVVKKSKFFLPLKLLGAHQQENARVAYKTLECIDIFLRNQLDRKLLKRTLCSVTVPGRLERFPGTPVLVLDGAHNPAAIDASFTALKKIYPQKPCIAVMGVARDKNLARILPVIERHKMKVVVTQSSSARARPVDDLMCAAGESSSMLAGTSDIKKALSLARMIVGQKGIVIVCGSFYLVADVKELLRRTGQ
jgi:dihydrofolate synthase / folylpolyglutamate synthase